MRRIYVILLCLLCLLLINSCTNKEPTENTNTTGNETATEQEDTTEQVNEETLDGSTPPGDVQRTEQSGPETKQVGETGSKQITITIVDRDGNSRDEVITTTAGDLLTALESSGMGSDAEDTPGYIVTVGGRAADPSQYEWWQISKDGLPVSSSADQTPIVDGEHYTFKLNGPE